VETVRRGLSSRYVGHRLDHVVVTGRRTVRRHPPARLEQLEGHVLRGVGRHGKYLLFEWDDDEILVAHLRMSGQMLAAQPGDEALPHTHAVLSFAGAGELRFVDPRTFGELFLGTPLGDNGPAERSPTAPPIVAEIEHLGPDALGVREPDLVASLAGRRAPLKSLLVDQRVLAGIGNIYADEICFEARLRPDRPGGSLKRPEVGRLAVSVRKVLGAAIAGRGSSLADRQYLDLDGEAGLYQMEHKVYGRAGEPCTACGRQVERARFGARSAFVCRSCQR
jgi:formamidopyrimidine-DNA glycosylase